MGKNILNIFEISLSLFVIFAIGMEYSGKNSSYRVDFDLFEISYLRIGIDLVLIGIFILRLFQIISTMLVKNAKEVKRRNLFFISLLYFVLLIPDLYQYFLWFYYAYMTPAGIRLIVYILPVVIWTYRMTKKQLITAPTRKQVL